MDVIVVGVGVNQTEFSNRDDLFSAPQSVVLTCGANFASLQWREQHSVVFTLQRNVSTKQRQTDRQTDYSFNIIDGIDQQHQSKANGNLEIDTLHYLYLYNEHPT